MFPVYGYKFWMSEFKSKCEIETTTTSASVALRPCDLRFGIQVIRAYVYVTRHADNAHHANIKIKVCMFYLGQSYALFLIHSLIDFGLLLSLALLINKAVLKRLSLDSSRLTSWFRLIFIEK